MMTIQATLTVCVRGVLVSMLFASLANAGGPSSSLWHRDVPSEQMLGSVPANAPFFYQPTKPRKELKLKDTVMIVVSEKSAMDSKGDVEAKKSSTFDAILKDWIKLNGTNIIPVKPSVEPEVNGNMNSDFKANSQLKTQDSLTFTITATVEDIRPNGNLVLEAHQKIQNNEEIWERSLTGIVRREDILPNNSIRSERIAELSIHKREVGHIRDGYRRGWWTKFWDGVSPY